MPCTGKSIYHCPRRPEAVIAAPRPTRIGGMSDEIESRPRENQVAGLGAGRRHLARLLYWRARLLRKDSKPLRASNAPSRARLPDGQVSLTSPARWPWCHYRRNSNLLTGATNYLEDINSILSTMLQTRTFLRPGSNVRLSGNVLLNGRDGWSHDIFAQNFAHDVLSLAGVDRSGVFKAAFINTAQSIINQRTPDAFYGAGWSGPNGTPNIVG